jgi:hypothetical protein
MAKLEWNTELCRSSKKVNETAATMDVAEGER